MSSGFLGNGFNDRPARVSNPIAIDHDLPFLAESLTLEFTQFTRKLFSPNGSYKVNTQAGRPVVSFTASEPKGPYLTMNVQSHWNDKILDREWSDPRAGLVAYCGDLRSIFDRDEGYMTPMPQSKGFKLAFKPGPMHSVYTTIKEQKCPHLTCLDKHTENIEGLMHRIISGPTGLF